MTRTSLFATSARRPLFLVPSLVLGLSLLSCGREVTGPEGGLREAAFALDPRMPAAFAVDGSGDVVPFDRVRVTLQRVGGELVKEEIVPFAAGTESVELALEVALPFGTTNDGIDLTLNMQYINAQGDTVFRVGPQTVTVVPASAGTPTPVVPVEVVYVGTGANATAVSLSPSGGSVVSGTTTTFTAVATDATEAPIPNTPVIFSSPDVTMVTVTPAGVATWLPVRGTARVIATLPTNADADTVSFTVTLPATKLAIVSGNGQAGSPGEPLESPIVLRVTATDDVPVAGVTVTFGVATGGGSVTPLTAVSDANGLVATSWTLGSAPGAQSITANYTGLAGGALTLNANGTQPPPTGVATWTGAVSQDFSLPGNWAGGVAPTATDSVIIPAGAQRNPILTATTTMVGAVDIQFGTLWMDGHTLITTGDFVTSNSGVLVMQDENDVLSIGGDAVFAGGDESGLLTAGGMIVGGNFTQVGANSPASFQAGPELSVVLQSINPTVTFANPGLSASQSRFGNLIWSGSGTMTQNSGVSVSGLFATAATTPITFQGIGGTAGRYLEFAQFTNSGPVVFDNIRVSVFQPVDAQSVTINNATFRNLPGTATQFSAVTPGGADITLDNVVFQTTPTTGVFVNANDLTPGDGQPLVVNVANPTPAAPGGFVSVAGGAVINWPAGVERTWVGTTSAAWTTASNWFPAAVPGPMDDVVIAPGMPFQPTSNTNVAMGSLHVPAGAAITITSGTFTVNGDIISDGGVQVNELSAGFRPNGIGRTIRGNFQNIDVRGAYSLSGPLNVENDIFIRGSLTVAGETISAGGNLALLSAGVIVMQNPADLVMIGGQALFTGGATEGLLTNGVLEVQGRLLQNNSGTGTPANSFAPTGAHTVRLAGTAAQEVDIFNTGAGPGTSHFANLDVSTQTGSINFSRFNTVYVTGTLISQPQGAEATLTSSNGGRLEVAGVNVNRLSVLNLPLTIGGGTLTQFDNVSFLTMPGNVAQLRIDNPGSAAPFTMNGLAFSTTPTAGGYYIDANDTDGATPFALGITVVGATPATPGVFVRATNGAAVNWTAPSDVRLWTGGASTTWSDALNWSGGIVPTTTDSVRITATANDPVLDASVTVSGLTIEDGGALDLNGATMMVTGSVVLPATAAITSAAITQFRLAATGAATVRGALPGTQILSGAYVVDGPTVVNGDLAIGGTLTVGGSALQVTGSLTTANDGALAMSGPADVTAAGNASFNGGTTEDLLTGGTIFIGGNFSQGGVNARSFSAGPGHTVVLNGTAAQTVTFATPDLATNTACAASCFGTLRTVRQPTDGAVQFLSDVKAVTQLDLSSGGVIDATGFTLLSGGAPSITASNFTAAKLGFVTGLARNVEIFAVDTLIGMGNGVVLPANLTTPTRLAGSYIIAGPHNASLEVTQGALEVAGRAVVGGSVSTTQNGWLRMQQAADTLIVNGDLSLAGVTPITQLTAGLLEVSGNLAQTRLGVASFQPDVAHKTRFVGTGGTIALGESLLNRFGTIEFDGTGKQVTSDFSVAGDVIVRTTSGPVDGADIVPVQMIQINGGLYDTTGGRWQVRNTRFNSVNPVVPATMATNAYFAEAVTLSRDMTFTNELNLVGNSIFDLNGNRVSVLGAFRSNENGRVRMVNAADTLSLSGNAHFGGGSTSSLMSNGTLELYGNLLQDGSPSSFAASGAHRTFFLGAGLSDQEVTFTNPGSGINESHFGHMILSQGTEGIAVRLLSDAWAVEQLSTRPSSSRRIRAVTSQLFHSRGAEISDGGNVEFSNVRWALTDGAAATIDGLRFTAMDPAAIQFSILRAGPTLALANLEFQTTPTTGAYMRVEDSDGAANGELVVAITGVTPMNHGGFLTVVAPATVTGWTQAPEFRWTGAASQDWAAPTNWSGGVIPGAADSVFIPAGTPNAPIVGVAAEIRTLAVAPGATLNLGATLVVHGSVDVAPTAAITASGGELDLSSATGGTISGALPQTRVLGGLFTLDGNVTIAGNLEVYGEEFTPGVPVEGDVSIGDFTLTSTGGLFVGLQGTFTMTGIGMADFATYVNFLGNSTAGKLTNGTLRVGTEFYQDGSDSPSSFQASGTHVVEFAGTSPEPRIFFTDPDLTPNATCASSCFATLRSIKAPGQGGLRFQSGAKILGTLQLQADSVSAPGFVIMAAGSPTFDTPILRAGAIGHEGTVTQNATTIQVDSLVAWGVGQVLGSIPGVRTVVTGSYTLDNVAFPSLLEVDGSVAIANNVSIASNLHVDGTVSLTAGDTPALLTVNGNLFVRGPGSALISSGQAHVIDVTGSATFNGANSTGNLVTGRLRVAGNFASQAFVSPLSFVAGPAYVVEFTGPGTIGISDPAQSTFGAIDFSNTGFSRTLNTDIRATGLVSLSASSFTMISGTGAGAGNTRRIFADRVDANGTGFTMFNVAITTRSFNSGVSGSISFNNFDPSVIQLEITESGALGSLLRNATFTTVPTGAGRYVRVTDATPTGGDGSPALVVQAPSPIFHGGAAEAIAPATMTGWAPAPDFRWTGAVDDAWTQPGNWADNIVPGAADSVYITDGFANAPAMPGQLTLRAFVYDATLIINMSSELTITERLVTNANMDCDGGEIILAGGVTPVLFSGDIVCGNVRITSGTAVPDGRVTVGSDLMVWGENAQLVLNRNTVVAPFFQTIGQGQLRMTEATDSLITQAATFGGGTTNGLLTDGVLLITGNFTQDATNSAESFAASGNHTTVFAGNAGNQQSFFATPGEGAGTSHFGNVEMSKGEVGTHVVLNSRTFALGVLRTGAGVPAQRFLANLTEPMSESVLFQSRGADVELMSFSNVKWSILDGAPITRMDQISFFAIDSASTHLNIERTGGATIGIRQIVFGPQPQEGDYIRIVDLDGAAGGTVTVNVDGVTPAIRNDQYILLVNGALLTGWPVA